MSDKESKNKTKLLLRITEVRNLGFSIIDGIDISLDATSKKDHPGYSDEKKTKQKVVLHFLNLTSDVLDWVLTKCKTEDDFLIQLKNLDFIEKEMKWCTENTLTSNENTLNYPDGRIYKGEFKDGVPHGTGTLTSVEGHQYVGEFKKGIFFGQGILTLANGDQYVGKFREGKYNGKGTLILADGNKYFGEFKDGKYDNQGTFTHSNGDEYEGSFKNSEYHGQGTF